MNNLKKIVHIADVHFYNMKRHEEYKEVLSNFINELRVISLENNGDIALLIAGDLVHQKIQISNELNIILSWFLRETSKICDVIIYAGNHDFIVNNMDRMDTLTAIVKLLDIPNIYYVDSILDYKSGVFSHKGVTFCLYSIFDNFKKPEIINLNNNKLIGLFHGAIVGSETSTGYTLEHGIDTSLFEGCSVVMAGDIHKRQEIRYKGVRIVYPGSTIQQDYGESIDKHGYLVWDLESLRYTEHELYNPYIFYKIRINSIFDLENNTERFINI